MPIVPAVCTKCGASLKVDASLDAAICDYCRTPFVVEKAINYYVQNITAGTVNVTGQSGFVITAGELKKYRGESSVVDIPDTVSKIGYRAFAGPGASTVGLGVTTVRMPTTVVEIGSSAFLGCASLEAVEIPESVQFIGDGAFKGSGLVELKLPQALVSRAEAYWLDYYTNYSSQSPRSDSGIAYGAFEDCRRLEAVNPMPSLRLLEECFERTPIWERAEPRISAEKAAAREAYLARRKAQERADQEELRRQRTRDGLCPGCGGKLTGLFSTCKNRSCPDKQK